MHVDIYESFLEIDKLWFLGGCSNIPKVSKIASLQCLYYTSKKKPIRDGFDFLQVDKYQSFMQVDFNTLGIEVSFEVKLLLLVCMIKHSHSIQSNKFAISLQYLKEDEGQKAF